MITPRLFSEPSERVPFAGGHAYFNPSFFRGELWRAWPKMLCYTLFFFFVLPLPILFEINSRNSWSTISLTECLTRMLVRNVWGYCFAAAAVAVFAGMLATRYLCRRTSVDYYHSLPIRREGLLIQGWALGVIHFLAALVINLLLSAVILATVAEQLTSMALPIGKLLAAAGYMLITFLLFYTLTVFCGMLCGTSSMQVMLTGLTLGAFPLFRALFLTFCETFTSNWNMDYFWNQSWGWTSPLIRLFYLADWDTLYARDYTDFVLENPLTRWETVLWLAATVFLLFGALMLYRRRRVERAGTPVVFGGVAAAVKWVVIVLATMAMGWLFLELGSGDFWMLFGFVLGGFLSFLLINTILTKNPKQMFDGWRGMLIYLVVFCVGSVGVGFAVSAIEKTVPKNISRISVCFEWENYSVPYYTDPEVIEEWVKLWEKDPDDHAYREMQEEFFTTYDGRREAESERTFRFGNQTVRISAYVKVGPLVIPYEGRDYIREDAEGLIRAVVESDEFEAGWKQMMAGLADAPFRGNTPEEADILWDASSAYIEPLALLEWLYGEVPHEKGESDSFVYLTGEIMQHLLEETPQDIGFDFFQSPTYATLEVPSIQRATDKRLSDGLTGSRWFAYSVTMNTPSLYLDLLSLDEDAFYGAMADMILEQHGGIYIAKHLHYEFTPSSEGVMTVTDRGQIIEILRGLSQLDTSGAVKFSDFTVLDEGYAVAFPHSDSDQVIYFIKGKVPAFVTEMLG